MQEDVNHLVVLLLIVLFNGLDQLVLKLLGIGLELLVVFRGLVVALGLELLNESLQADETHASGIVLDAILIADDGIVNLLCYVY